MKPNKTKNPPESGGRIAELDLLRGIALILMCLDHLMIDLSELAAWAPGLAEHPVIRTLSRFGEAVSYSDWRLVLHYIFATVFLLTAGIGSALTRHPLRRCGKIAAGALVISAATVLLDIWLDLGVTIVFGVLSAMTVGCILCWIASHAGGRWTALFIGGLMVVTGFCLKWYDAPTVYRLSGETLWKTAVGTVRFGADWFPIFPCAGVILIGYFLGKTLYPQRKSRIPGDWGKRCPICTVGRYPLWIYLLHQPVIAGILFAGIGILSLF